MADGPHAAIEIRLSGIGGQGLVLAGEVLAQAFTRERMRVALSLSYEPTSRGGLSRSDIVASREQVEYPLVTTLDQLLILDQFAAHASTHLVAPGCLVLVDAQRVTQPPAGEFDLVALPLYETARALGNPRAANIVALGVLAALREGAGMAALEAALRDRTPERFLEANVAALAAGHELGTSAQPAAAAM